jgi:hypothetical protein
MTHNLFNIVLIIYVCFLLYSMMKVNTTYDSSLWKISYGNTEMTNDNGYIIQLKQDMQLVTIPPSGKGALNDFADYLSQNGIVVKDIHKRLNLMTITIPPNMTISDLAKIFIIDNSTLINATEAINIMKQNKDVLEVVPTHRAIPASDT